MADYLVGKGVPFRRAHEIVGALVRKLIAEERDFESLSLEEWRAASELFEAGRRRAHHAGGVGAGQADAAVDRAGGRRRPAGATSGTGWTASRGRSAKIESAFRNSFPASGILRER